MGDLYEVGPHVTVLRPVYIIATKRQSNGQVMLNLDDIVAVSSYGDHCVVYMARLGNTNEFEVRETIEEIGEMVLQALGVEFSGT